jgi:uncharacterized phage-like protein YoqJ
MKNKTCCFTGHREIPNSEYAVIHKRTREEIMKLIEKGIERFIVGGALGFDTLAATLLFEIRENYPNIKIIVAVPYRAQAKGFSESDLAIYNEILRLADETVILSENYFRGCLHARNRYMVDESNVIISYLRKESGGSAFTTGYARKKGIEIIEV